MACAKMPRAEVQGSYSTRRNAASISQDYFSARVKLASAATPSSIQMQNKISETEGPLTDASSLHTSKMGI